MEYGANTWHHFCPLDWLIPKQNVFRMEGTMWDWGLATEAVEEEPSRQPPVGPGVGAVKMISMFKSM